MTVVDLAQEMAEKAHKGQKYGDKPYTTHLADVASRVEGSRAKVVAWLHDVVEDTDTPLDMVSVTFGRVVGLAVDYLTKRDDEEYMTYINRVNTFPLARAVKIADLESNIEAGGKPHLKPRYLNAWRFLCASARVPR